MFWLKTLLRPVTLRVLPYIIHVLLVCNVFLVCMYLRQICGPSGMLEFGNFFSYISTCLGKDSKETLHTLCKQLMCIICDFLALFTRRQNTSQGLTQFRSGDCLLYKPQSCPFTRHRVKFRKHFLRWEQLFRGLPVNSTLTERKYR